MSELFDALRRPSFNAHGNGLANEAAAFGRRQAKAARNGHRAGEIRESGAESVNSVAQQLTPRSPSRIRADRIATPQAARKTPVRRTDRAASFVERNLAESEGDTIRFACQGF
jgi:hypothetical protein